MGRQSNKMQMQFLMPQYKIIHNKVKNPVQHHITGTAYTITKELFRTDFAEWFIEKIYKISYYYGQSLHL